MRAAHHRDKSRARRGAGVDRAALARRARRRAGGQLQPLGAAAFAAAAQPALGRGRHEAKARAPAAQDRDVTSDPVAPSEGPARAVERVNKNKAVGKAGGGAPLAASSDTTATPGSTRARPARIAASAASSHTVTG